ncbi:hypothetical protein [Serratia marcescens]|uniref:hypothetical protein n=1 Tax=Serratia TaxID=613 RepID=UPI003B9FB749
MTESFAIILRVTDGAIEESALVFRLGELASKVQLPCDVTAIISQLLPDSAIPTASTVWPTEVEFLFSQCGAELLPNHLQHKLRHHINRLKLEGSPEQAIIQTAKTLTAAMRAAS